MILTVDLALTINGSKILLIKRAKEPFTEKLVLPGGHVEDFDCDLKAACTREALEEINLSLLPESLELLTVLDGLHRDPRPGRRISVVFHVDLPDEDSLKRCFPASDAKEIILRELEELSEKEIGFDHWKAIELLKR